MTRTRFKAISLLSCLWLQCFISYQVFCQSEFESSDFATLDDSFIVSHISILDIPNHDYTVSGAGVTWDYSAFVPVSQEHKRFTDPDATGFRTAYFLSCNSVCYNDCYDNCVTAGGFPLICAGSCNLNCNATCLNNWFTKFDLAELSSDSIGLIITSIEDIFNFYDITPDALSLIAVGAKLSGFPIVVEYTNPDRVYSFPLQYGNLNTSFSNYSIQLDSVPGLPIAFEFSYNHSQQRFNNVEGWGTLITPYGTFNNVLKMKTILNNQDTVTIDGNATPLNIIPQTIEYKWFSPDYGIPLLTVTARVIGGNLIYQNLEYLDSLRCFDPAAIFGYQPFPAVINQGEDSIEVSFFSLSINGDSFTWDFGDSASSQNTATGADASHVFKSGGLYNIRLTTCNTACTSHICDDFTLPVLIIDLSDDTVSSIPLVPQIEIDILPNPFRDRLLINVNCVKDEILNLDIFDQLGKRIYAFPGKVFPPGKHALDIDMHALQPGVYLVKVQSELINRVFKLTKARE